VEGFSITTERITSAGSGVADVGTALAGEISTMQGLLDEIRSGIPSHASEDLAAQPQPTAAEFRERMSGNICRCGAYSNIQEAIAEVAGIKA